MLPKELIELINLKQKEYKAARTILRGVGEIGDGLVELIF